MNDQPANLVTQSFAWLAALAAGLGITTQDMVYMIFGRLSVLISLASWLGGRLDARRQRLEDQKRTRILQTLVDDLQNRNRAEQIEIVRAVSEVLKKAGS